MLLDSPRRQTYLFQRPNGKPFTFAGLWERWDGGEETLETCTNLTTEANKLASAYHDRMPVILSWQAVDRWLDPSAKDVAALTELLKPTPEKFLTAVPVSTRVNSPKNDTPECIEPVTDV